LLRARQFHARHRYGAPGARFAAITAGGLVDVGLTLIVVLQARTRTLHTLNVARCLPHPAVAEQRIKAGPRTARERAAAAAAPPHLVSHTHHPQEAGLGVGGEDGGDGTQIFYIKDNREVQGVYARPRAAAAAAAAARSSSGDCAGGGGGIEK
jgi:hypothetical protein